MKYKALEDKFSIKIDYLVETTSTNDIARADHYRDKDIVIADRQTKGRGQRGNKWSSADGKNLTFSMVLAPHFLTPDMQFLISKFISVSLVDALSRHGIDARIKWTNDIYVDDKKIVGILIENDIIGDRIHRSIVGIGLNVNQTEFDPTLPNPVSMALIAGAEFDMAEILVSVLDSAFKRYEAFSAQAIESDYASKLYRREGLHTFRDPQSGEFRASITDVLSTGELILRHSDGTEKSYLFKEVEFVI